MNTDINAIEMTRESTGTTFQYRLSSVELEVLEANAHLFFNMMQHENPGFWVTLITLPSLS